MVLSQFVQVFSPTRRHVVACVTRQATLQSRACLGILASAQESASGRGKLSMPAQWGFLDAGKPWARYNINRL